MKTSKHQLEVLKILYEDGDIKSFDDGDLIFSDSDGNILGLRKDTFKTLLNKQLVVFSYAPAIGVNCYGITTKGSEFVRSSTQKKGIKVDGC